jgi:hypothetical protein
MDFRCPHCCSIREGLHPNTGYTCGSCGTRFNTPTEKKPVKSRKPKKTSIPKEELSDESLELLAQSVRSLEEDERTPSGFL